ncbi:MAG: 23S rRNA (uracil(1939)-C(5))-methyltransferase RlmD [Coriobacteriaceae bacterium]|nr:23S rRNA (uracil(1939)-C(5))-methyltransferase RlmD [Coriobacteriaceae bacterium]
MQLTIESMMYGPDGLAHDADGKAIFVAGGLVGDTVEAELTEEGATFSRACAVSILEPSPDRVEAPCPLASVCGGCPWGCLSRSAQLAAKEENLRSSLERIGKFTHEETAALMRPIRHAKDAWGYRNKIELAPTHVGERFRLGMHGRSGADIVLVDACPLFERKFAKAVKGVVGALGYLGNSRDLELERVGIRASRRTGALEVALWTPTGGFPRAQVSRVLADALKPTSVVRVMSKGDRRARRVSGVEALSGEGSWTEKIKGETMRLSAPSFFQVNTAAAEILIELVMEALAPAEHEVAVDLYSGAGTFTLPLARRASWVAAVEAYGPAVRDLRRNLEIAGLDNVDVIGGDAVREFPDEEADVLVVDPPRAGLAPEAVDLISGTAARDVAYVSCDPATLARDLRRFVDAGTFRPVSATPVDLFPQTFHAETVVHLTRA